MHKRVSIADRSIDEWERAYEETSSSIAVSFRSLLPDLKADRFSHLLHAYPAKLLPHIPYFFLRSERLAPPSQSVAVGDPFCGSGTVLLEAALKGFSAIGADTNPLARLISRVKTTPIDAITLDTALSRLRDEYRTAPPAAPPCVVNLSMWFLEDVALELAKIRTAILQIAVPSVRDFFSLSLSICARKMSLADPRIAVPVRIQRARRDRYGAHYRQLSSHLDNLLPDNVWPTFEQVALANIRRMASMPITSLGNVTILDKATSIGSYKPASLDLIITSPPYLGAQKYIRSSSISLGWLDLAYDGQLRALEQLTIGREHFTLKERVEPPPATTTSAAALIDEVASLNPLRGFMAATYLSEMVQALTAICDALKPGGYVVLIVGQNSLCGRLFDTPLYLREIANSIGLESKFLLHDQIRSRGLMTKRHPTAGFIAHECVMGMRKPG